MSHALEGTPKPTVTLTEQANGQRIARSMFIGHTVGYRIVFAVLNVLVGQVPLLANLLGFYIEPSSMFTTVVDLSTMPPALHVSLLSGNLIASGILFGAAVLVWCDLIIRRRHDRGRSGIDGVLWLVLLVVSQIAWIVAPVPRAVGVWLDLLVYAGALYLFVVLVILPGNPHENRYGAVPRPD